MSFENTTDLDYMSDSSDSENSYKKCDFDESDNELLDHAEEIMNEISPIKSAKKKRTGLPNQSVALSESGPIASSTPKATKQGNKKKKNLKLKKTDTTRISLEIEDEATGIAEAVINTVKNEHFWKTMTHGLEFVTSILQSDILLSMTLSIVKDYTHLYNMHHKGQSPYQEFQMSWFQNAKKYLACASTEVKTSMDQLCGEFVQWDYKSNLISSLHMAVAEQCSKLIINKLKDNESSHLNDQTESFDQSSSANTNSASSSEDYLMYKVHGWIIREIRQHPQLKSVRLDPVISQKWQNNIWKLTATKTEDDLPMELKLVDLQKGEGLTFPKPVLYQFMFKADRLFKELSSDENFKTFGSQMAAIIKLQMKSHLELFNLFKTACKTCEVDDDISSHFYNIWMEKYCNVRIKDRLAGKELVEVHESDKISGKTQNLRDGLLTDHVSKKHK